MENDNGYSGMASAAMHSLKSSFTEHPHLTPIFATSTFTFDSAEQGMDRFSGKVPGFTYSRFGNPTTAAAEQLLANLEAFGLQDEKQQPLQLKALLHASGQGAMVSMFLSNLSGGDGVLSHPSLYGGTHEFLCNLAARFGIRTLITDFSDLNQVEDTIRRHPFLKIIHVETPANPTMNCIDLEAVCSLARKYQLLVTVDNTFATPYLQQPFRYGADFVFHSTTKFLNGHGTSIGGVFIGRDIPFMTGQGYRTYKLLGANSNPFDAFLLIQGVKTIEMRMTLHCQNALKVAEFLSRHPSISRVNYNGLPDHPGYAITVKQMRMAGSMLSFELKDGFDAGKKFINRLKMCVRAVSLGTVDTLISHPASMSHSGLTPEERLAAGITDGLIRMSVGLENIADILNDLDQALSQK